MNRPYTPDYLRFVTHNLTPAKDPFTYQKPDDGQVNAMNHLRAEARNMRSLIQRLVPAGPDREEAIRHLRATVMWSNAAIVLEETS